MNEIQITDIVGCIDIALGGGGGGGVSMSRVDFKKCMSLMLINAYVACPCRMSNLRNGPVACQ